LSSNFKRPWIDSIRLRVWVNPPNGYCNKEETIKMALRAKKMGFRIMINFHYSDSWPTGETNKTGSMGQI